LTKKGLAEMGWTKNEVTDMGGNRVGHIGKSFHLTWMSSCGLNVLGKPLQKDGVTLYYLYRSTPYSWDCLYRKNLKNRVPRVDSRDSIFKSIMNK
jgi:hypothetical protein